MSDLSLFSTLYDRFLHSFLHQARGRRLAGRLEEQRDEAMRHYRAVSNTSGLDADRLTLLLAFLLPREREYGEDTRRGWYHPLSSGSLRLNRTFTSSAALREFRQGLFETVYRFVSWCLDDPNDLLAACADLARSPYAEGLHAGHLSPLLNALRPDGFQLVTGKSVRVYNRLVQPNLQLSLASYPASNDALIAFLDRQSGLILRPDAPEIRGGDLFALFAHWLVSIERYTFPGMRYWSILVSDASEWSAWREGNFVALVDPGFGDLDGLTRGEFETLCLQILTRDGDRSRRSLDALWRFANFAQEGDPILAETGDGEILGFGRMDGPYSYVDGMGAGHIRPARWEDLQRRITSGRRRRNPFVELDATAFQSLSDAPVSVDEHRPEKTQEAIIREEPAPYTFERETEAMKMSLADLAESTLRSAGQLESWLEALERKGQALFYGPPGTGKSFLALEMARYLTADRDGFYEMVQFHPAYTYEDFVQGLRPQRSSQGRLDYRMQPGRFLEFCRRAAAHSGRAVLVIDEINRADLSAVFGEILFALEYRDRTVPLAAGGELMIPANVRLLATMNSADRSLALVDYALRRRFAFLSVSPDFDVLASYHQGSSNAEVVASLTNLLSELNNEIGDPAFALGITYFLHPDLASSLPSIWQAEVEPFLEEYFFDRPAAVEPWRWAQISKRMIVDS